MDKIRPATPEEMKEIADTSDVTPLSKGFVYKGIKGVWRITNEADPIYFNGASDRDKVQFLFAMQHFLMGTGATEFYFQVPVNDEKYQSILEHLGMKKTSREPEYRYKVSLT